MMSVTALFATAGATNAGLYPAAGLCEQMASNGQFPPVLGRRFRDRAPAGLIVTALAASVLSVGFDLTSIASLGSAVALIVFTFVTGGHLRVHKETGARPWLLVVAIVSTVIVLATFAVTTLVDEPDHGRARRDPVPERRARPRLEALAWRTGERPSGRLPPRSGQNIPVEQDSRPGPRDLVLRRIEAQDSRQGVVRCPARSSSSSSTRCPGASSTTR